MTTRQIFKTPTAVVSVPAATEAAARAILARYSYQGAPVESWPLIGTVS